MRRLIFLIACLALAMPVSLAAAKHAPVNHVFGDFTWEIERSTVQFTFDVTGDPLSTAASGSFRHYSDSAGTVGEMTGSIDCLRVVGNTAYISGTVTGGNLISLGTRFYTPIMDASPDGIGDMFGGFYLDWPNSTGTGPLTCTEVKPPELVITTGNIVIEQCDKVTGSGKCKTKD
jgi:hypothetical protein